jgi:ferredoxin-2, mitochondrial
MDSLGFVVLYLFSRQPPSVFRVCLCAVCACSTCHLILPHAIYDSLPEPSEDEEDMLDMAFGLSETSRLGCQVKVTTRMEGMVLEMPKATRNFYVDGHKPKPH